MKIALVYFTRDLPAVRKHHEVTDLLLRAWATFYERSGTTLEPILLTDRSTQVPEFWRYGVEVLADSEPPEQRDVLNKVGWMKSQAYALLGKCLVMDLDAFILRSIDELAGCDHRISMAPDPGGAAQWSAAWPEVGQKHNAGVLLLNSPEILPEFRALWREKQERFLEVTFFDELIFSVLLHRMGGQLAPCYNVACSLDDAQDWQQMLQDPATKVLHFSGKRKLQMQSFLQEVLGL